jgi:C-terminal processing protease CtpA/Prc
MRRLALLTSLVTAALGCESLILDAPHEKDAQALYDELWQTFDERYAPFEARGVDWDAAFDRHRPAPSSDDDDLFTAATGLLAELDDGHVTLVAPDRPVFVAQRSFREDTFDFHLDLGIVFQRMETGPFRAGAARYGVLEGDVGYVHVSHWGESIPHVDDLLDLIRPRRGVIIDLRHNPGGDFRNGFLFARHFADVRRLAFTTRTKTGTGRGELGQRVEWHIEPGPGAPIDVPVVVLTNGLTNSAAERTLMAFQVLPNVTVMGSPTAGNHGEKVGGELSNGWQYSIVPQVVTDAEGRVFEGPGIPPEVPVDNTEAEVLSGLDRQLEAAIAFITGSTTWTEADR